MDADLFFVFGLIIAGFSFPSIVNSFSEGRGPRVAILLLVIGGGMVAFAINSQPGKYTFATIPDAFVRVVGQFIN